MDEEELQSRLSRIATRWTLVAKAHGGKADEAAARERLIERYHRAVYRYLLGATRDPNVADEILQDFAVRFLTGAFRGARSERGRFRDYLKTAVSNLINDYRRRQRRTPAIVAENLDRWLN